MAGRRTVLQKGALNLAEIQNRNEDIDYIGAIYSNFK